MPNSMDIKKLFKRKNWRLFQEGDYIIQSILYEYIKPEEHVRKIIKLDIKHLWYIWEDGEQSGKIYFRQANAFELASPKLKALHKILIG